MEQRSKSSNAVGAQIRKLRSDRDMTQERLVARCQLLGCNITRGTLAKVEAQIRGCSAEELFVIAKVLGVEMKELFPRGFAAKRNLGGAPKQ